MKKDNRKKECPTKNKSKRQELTKTSRTTSGCMS